MLATTSDHLNEIINMEENQQHNLEYDMSTMADAECIKVMIIDNGDHNDMCPTETFFWLFIENRNSMSNAMMDFQITAL